MLIFDGDYPMAYGAIELNRDLTLPIEDLRANEDNPSIVPMASLPEMRRGRVAGALMKFTVRMKREGSVLPGFKSTAAAYGFALGQVEYYHMLARQGEGTILTTRTAFKEHMAQWEQASDTNKLPVGFVIGMEGADPILSPDCLSDWWDKGVRVVSLTHYGVSTYAYGTGTNGGLRSPAKELLHEMEKQGIILDMTHISDDSFWEAVNIFNGPIIASHQNCRSLVPGERQFTDEQLKVVIERGGVIGASMDTWMLYPENVLDWAKTGDYKRRDYFPREAVTLQHIADHVDHVCQLAGNTKHAAIGGDTDGQGGVDGAPSDVDTIADYQKLVPILTERGYSEHDIANIMYRNWQRFYEQWLPV